MVSEYVLLVSRLSRYIKYLYSMIWQVCWHFHCKCLISGGTSPKISTNNEKMGEVKKYKWKTK